MLPYLYSCFTLSKVVILGLAFYDVTKIFLWNPGIFLFFSLETSDRKLSICKPNGVNPTFCPMVASSGTQIIFLLTLQLSQQLGVENT